MQRSTSRRSPADRATGREVSRPSRTAGVVLESVTTVIDGKEVNTEVFSTSSSSHRNTTARQLLIAPSQTIVRRPSTSRRTSPPRIAERTGHKKVPSVARTIVYTYPDRSVVRPQERQESTRIRTSLEPVVKSSNVAGERWVRDGSRTRLAVEDAYRRLEVDDMGRNVGPGLRRSGSNAVSNRRPVSMYDTFPSSSRSVREYRPSSITRGIESGGLARHGSLREPRRRSPPQYRSRDVYASDDNKYGPPSAAHTASRRDEREYHPRERYDDRRRPSPADRSFDRNIADRGFGLVPGASNYNGSKVEALSRAPPLAAYTDTTEDKRKMREYVPDLDRAERYDSVRMRGRREKPAERQQERDHDDGIRYDYDTRDGPYVMNDRRDERQDTTDRRRYHEYDERRPRNQEKRRSRQAEKRNDDYDDYERAYRNQRESCDDERYERRAQQDQEQRRYRPDEVLHDAEALLGAGVAAGAAHSLGKDKRIRDQEETQHQRQPDKARERYDEPRKSSSDIQDRNKESSRKTSVTFDDTTKPGQVPKQARKPPGPAEREVQQDLADSPEQPRRRRYVNDDLTLDTKRDQSDESTDPDEEYHRRMRHEAEKVSKSAALPDEDTLHKRPTREDQPPEPPRQPSHQPDHQPPIADLADSPDKNTTNALLAPTSKPPPPQPKSILRAPTSFFPSHPPETREGVLALRPPASSITSHPTSLTNNTTTTTTTTLPDPPTDARWTKIKRDLISLELLEKRGERFEVLCDEEGRGEWIVVLRVLGGEEVGKLVRESREVREWRRERGREGRKAKWDGGGKGEGGA